MIYVVFVYFLILAFFVWKKGFWKISIYLIGVYLLSFYGAILLISDQSSEFEDGSLLSSLVLTSFLTITFLPYIRKTPKIVPINVPRYRRRFVYICYGISSLLLLGIVLLFPKIQEAFQVGLGDLRQAMYRGQDTLLSAYSFTERLGYFIIKHFGYLAYACLIMFFYSLCFMKGKNVMKVMLLIASLGRAYQGSLNGGRTHLIYWVLFFCFCVVLYWPYISKKGKLYLLLITSVIGVALASYFVYMTYERIDKNNNTLDSFLLSYLGQSYPRFCDFFENIDWHPYTLQRIFPLVSSFFMGRIDLTVYRDYVYANTHYDIGIFYTFLGDIFVDIGIMGLLLFVLLYFLLAKRFIKKKVITISDLLVLNLFIQIPLHGVFYYSLYTIETSLCVIMTLLLALYLKKANRRSKRKYKTGVCKKTKNTRFMLSSSPTMRCDGWTNV